MLYTCLFSLLVLSVACLISSFHTSSGRNSIALVNSKQLLQKRIAFNLASTIDDVPEEIKKLQCIHNMVMVERLSAPEKSEGGIFIPLATGGDVKRLGKVLSIPVGYGKEGERGYVTPIETIAPYKIGDIVCMKFPWGSGPAEVEVGKRCFSFQTADQIVGVVE